MLFHISARSKDGKTAYATRVLRYRTLSDGRIYYEDMNNSMYFTDADSIIIDPEIIQRVSGDWLYKIRLKGE